MVPSFAKFTAYTFPFLSTAGPSHPLVKLFSGVNILALNGSIILFCCAQDANVNEQPINTATELIFIFYLLFFNLVMQMPSRCRQDFLLYLIQKRQYTVFLCS